ncbi:glycerophosphoryl diester phosphodiesterase [Seminavis robusta]|uniref:Glycerophosphoryl diester phosphodiesterase n=1 Tax=Seminavis robusta TaxID=568900 RepID=A0A9N8EIH1_9STRA|nr:glycerophosphoryl diester phosphodiesterase [Seminavis robusta]|eukprot:Sro1132_g244740.1 glycerophosphoryl diester phosphodiesterase (605) ;mRNA; r:11483-13297
MVKFGRHQKFFVEHEHHLDNAFIVPYNDAKLGIEEEHVSRPEFEAQWHTFLQKATAEFDLLLKQLWRQVFSAVCEHDEARGAPPEKALVLFTQLAPDTLVLEVAERFKDLRAIALLNAEALRKLVKKFDKAHRQHVMSDSATQEQDAESDTNKGVATSLSVKLLPEIYAANFVIGLTALQQGIDLLRSELGLGDHVAPDETTTTTTSTTAEEPVAPSYQEDDKSHNKNHTFSRLTRDDRKDSHAEHDHLVDKRRQELLWLRQSVERINQLGLLPNLVAHRGFHSPQDRSDRRPLENSLEAYERAWSSGIHLCECDIALTRDERLILAHDEDFSRLALDTSCEKSSRNVRDLTFQEIMGLALKSGSRPPLLLDVLQSAHAIGGQSQLIIEIKPGNREAASALTRLFGQHPYLMAHCAVVMSFDSFVVHSLQEELDARFGSRTERGQASNSSFGHRRCYSMGIFPSPVIEQGTKSAQQSIKYERPKLIVLTVSDVPKREVELQVSIGEQEEEVLKKIRGWVKGRLDGVYLQFEPQMLTPDGVQVLQKLARRYHVGVWGHNGRDPDDYATFSKLVQEGKASFVNTDLPRDYFHSHESSRHEHSSERL